MRDQRFVAVHRGGTLSKEQHGHLIQWAHDCAGHVLPLFGEKADDRLQEALLLAGIGKNGETSVGSARKASLEAISVAHELSDPVEIAVARAVGHAVATFHMADHSLRAAEYALKAIRLSGKSTDQEREWQDDSIPADVRELVLSSRKKRSTK